MNGKVNWDIFAAKFSGEKKEAFEWLAYHMFCREYGITEGLQEDYCHPYIESKPARLPNGTVVGFQAKYYEGPCVTSKYKSELLNALKGAKAEYNDINKIHFYLSRPLSHSSKKGKQGPKWQEEIYEEARRLGIEVQWIVPSNFDILLNNDDMRDLWEFFFEFPHIQTDPFAIQSAKLRIDREGLEKYYKRNKNGGMKGVIKKGIFRSTDYFPLMGICENEDTAYFVELLDLILKPTKVLSDSKFANVQFIVIYGLSRSGLSFLCETAFQSFLNDKSKSDFDNMAYFSIVEDDISEEGLYEKLCIDGRTIFSESFSEGLLIIDGLGKVLEDSIQNSDSVNRLIELIKFFSEDINHLKVLITVRMNGNPLGCLAISDENVMCVQNLMVHHDSDEYCNLTKQEVLNDSYESKEVFKNPQFLLSLKRLVDDSKLGDTETEVIYQSICEDRDDAEIGFTNNKYAKLAFEIFSQKYHSRDIYNLYTSCDAYRGLSNNRFIVFEDNKVGFRSSVVFEFFVALYLFELFNRIDLCSLFNRIDGEDSIMSFLNCLSQKEIPDKRYNDEYSKMFKENVSTNHELILLFLRDICLDVLDEMRCQEKMKLVFDYICCEKILHREFNKTAIKNYIKIYMMFNDSFTNEISDKLKYVLIDKNFDSMCMPNMTCIPDTLNRSRFERIIFSNLFVGGSIPSIKAKKGGRYKRIELTNQNNSEMQFAIFRKSQIGKAEFIKMKISHCTFDEVEAEECSFEDSEITYCSFLNAHFKKVSFKGAKIAYTCLDIMTVNCDAFKDALYFENGNYKKLENKEWEKLGIQFMDKPV